MKILFIDLTCPVPYNNKSLKGDDIVAGTERSVIQIAEELSKNNEVYVTQHCRIDDEISENHANYISLNTATCLTGKQQPDVVILLRKYQRLKEFISLYPDAKIFFWMHDLPEIKMRKYISDFIRYNCGVICVSNFHKQITEKTLRGKWYHKLLDILYRPKTLNIHVIYNPIPNDLTSDNTIIDKNKLIFYSSPNKGLNETLLLFNKLIKIQSKFNLYIANPGYIPLDRCKQLNKELLQNPNIIILGRLNHEEILKHVRQAFCVFYPQQYKAETFGLVYAEANAVGTPVLAHDFGAAKEVLNNDDQLVDVRQPNAVLNRLINWYKNGRPSVHVKNAFYLSNVAKQWKQLLNFIHDN